MSNDMTDDRCEEVRGEMARRFKVGDKVQIVANNSGHFFTIGRTCRLKNKVGGSDWQVETLDGKEFWWLCKKDFKRIEEAK